MPEKPSKICPGRGVRTGRCPNKVKKVRELCPECTEIQGKKNLQHDRQRYQEDAGRRFWQSRAGKRERERYIIDNPLCVRCLEKGVTVPAKRVHHKDRNPLNRSYENKEALCVTCHEKEHVNERFGRNKFV